MITIIEEIDHVRSHSGYHQKLLPTELLITDPAKVKHEWYTYMRYTRADAYWHEGEWVSYTQLRLLKEDEKSEPKHAWDVEHWEDWATNGQILYEHRANYRVDFGKLDHQNITGQQLCDYMTEAVDRYREQQEKK